jgi:uncharacterized protein (DUF2249 family)
VEPKDRFDRIMGAYEGLVTDQALELTVDHDPKCMYYALRPPAAIMRSLSSISRTGRRRGGCG